MERLSEQDTKWNRQPLSAVLFCIIGALINIAGSSIAVRFKLPMFLDSIGTILTAAFGGYLPGIAVGYITNVINGISDVTNSYYAFINVLLAIAAAFFEKKGFFKKLGTTVIAILTFALIGGGVGSLLTYFIYGFSIGEGISAPFAVYIYEHYINSVFYAQLSADFIIDIIDKIVTVIIALVIMRLIPKRLRPLIHFYGWHQSPLTDEERREISKQNTRGLSLQHKIIIMVSAAIFLIALCTVGISFVLYHKAIIAEYSATCGSTAALASSVIDGDRVAEYIEKGHSAEGYDETETRIAAIKDANEHIKFIYIYKIEEDGCTVVFDLPGTDENGDVLEPSPPGDKIEFDPTFMQYVPKLLQGEEIPAVISDDTYGWLLTVYKPVFDSSGNCVCYAAADISMNHVTLQEISFLVKGVSLFFGFYLLIIAIGLWLAEYNVILPIKAMSLAAEDFAFNTEMEREHSVARFKKLDIKTGDEIEHLYKSFSQTISETDDYIEDIQNKSRLINKMQNGLILVLADIVESRDKCTGDHIKKTAAYTRIIMNKLRKMGVYTDILTDEYVEDVVNSAPLHDIGKIKIPDSILNKPGKLTDEEFDIMKTHTTAGAEIIDGAMELVSESVYLKEAKNLAFYHHEKWNGMGYPKGLKEDEIPLSARIMAVADVFDALVSRRSYKEPFTFEKAMSIIIEGSGNHFEPAIVDAFVASKDEVRIVAEKNLKTNDIFH
ncbi:MAG: HD domain-containing protein [Firmicutes bacterium]|nr:HD domain-containing protein [Bacillota bacterium]